MNLFTDYPAVLKTLNTYHNRFRFDLPFLNDITGGGIASKHLMVLASGAKGGKTTVLSHLAVRMAMSGIKVVYISLEQPKEEIAARMYANLMEYNIRDFEMMTEAAFGSALERTLTKHKNSVAPRVTHFNAGSANAEDFKQYIKHLEETENFQAQVVFVDYIQIMKASVETDSSYERGGGQARGLKALANDCDVAVITAAQFNRTGSAFCKGGGKPDFTLSMGESHQITTVMDWGILFHQDKGRMRFENSLPRHNATHSIVVPGKAEKTDEITVDVDWSLYRLRQPVASATKERKNRSKE
jgi:archaellum biogenesis ATPase FlaH